MSQLPVQGVLDTAHSKDSDDMRCPLTIPALYSCQLLSSIDCKAPDMVSIETAAPREREEADEERAATSLPSTPEH
jgi:hypothetical protein